MHILHLVPSIAPIYGGVTTAVIQLAQSLQAQGCEITLATTNAAGDSGQVDWAVPLGQVVDHQGLRVIYFPRWTRFKIAPALTQWLWEHGRNFDGVHLHAVFSYPTLSGGGVCRAKRIPYVLSPHGMLDPREFTKKSTAKKIYSLLERETLRGCSALHFTCEEEKQVSETWGTQPPKVIVPLGVPPAPDHAPNGSLHQRLGLDPTIPLVLFLSRWDPKKGLDRLLPALALVKKQGVAFHLVLAGGGQGVFDQQVQRWIYQYGLTDQITCPGFVRGLDREEYLRESSLFVLPSYYENFGLAVAEAMAWGLPVLITKGVYIWREIQQAQAGIVVGDTPEALAQGLIQLLQDPALRATLGHQGQELTRTQYNWDQVAQQMIKVYQQIMP